MDDVLSLLDRQIDALERQPTTVEFLVSIEPALRALESEPRLAVHLEDLRDETLNRVVVFEQADAELVPAFVDLRQRLAALHPSSDDSDTPRPEHPASTPSWSITLAAFDAVAQSDPTPLNYKGDGARAGRLLDILANKAAQIEWQRRHPQTEDHASAEMIGAIPPEDEWEAWTVDLHNLRERWAHASRWLQLSMRVSAGLALLKLDNVPRVLNPDPAFRTVGEDSLERAQQTLHRAFSLDRILYAVVHDHSVDDTQRELADEHVADLRAGLSRLHTELHRRVGMTRSRRALLDRFKQRAEWHDVPRLRNVAADAQLPGGPEDRLTAELARYLFDQGLNPLTKPLTAGLEPDLLDPTLRPVFYVEAKQYTRSDRPALVRSLAQILDTVGRLRGQSYPLSEAFCVVFRRDGPRYLLPEWVQAEGYRVYFTLVDIAPAEVSGRRQTRRPIEIAAHELLEAASPPDER